ncbi:MAG TPA: glycosyltransferase family 9 protein [Candidatus Deferrimicrobium sp.]|nr:glycosyltransferase family 9 protein [Candidatus Deferrimicrobium sp.]
MDRLKPVEHRIKALVFGACKRLLKRKHRQLSVLDGASLHRVLFLRPEKIGDMVISLPVFDALKQRFPQIRISILASPKNYDLIKNDPRFNKIFLYRKNLWRDTRTMLAIRRERYDCVVDMICDDSVTALFLSQLAAPGKPRIGVGKVKFRQYYDFNYDHRLGDTGHIIDNTLQLLQAFGVDSGAVCGYAAPHLDQPSLAKADQYIATVLNGRSSALTIGYNLSAGSPTRLWHEDKAVELLRRILETDDRAIIILFAVEADRTRAERLRNRVGDRVSLVRSGQSLTDAAALIRKLHVLISPDTSLVHIARSLRVPVVGLYSRFMKNFLLWRPYGQEGGAVVSDNDNNIFDITPGAVFEAFLQVTRQAHPAPRP